MARLALYSHDAQGLGHVRRSLALATALSRLRPRPDVLIVTGAEEAAAFPRPPGCDVLGLPSIAKLGVGRYAARHLSLPLPQLALVRGAVIAAALAEFAPDVLVVDRHPRGIAGELEPALRALPARTRVVLGLRDVLDDDASTLAQWRRERSAEALEQWYDEVWVYGDRRVHDAAGPLDLPARLRARVQYTGYLARGRDLPSAGWSDLPARFVLGMVGGGSDGANLARAFAAAERPRGLAGLLVLGPQMPAEDRAALHAAGAAGEDLHVLDFVADTTPLLDGAEAAVTMGGYNTICELLARGTRTLVVPRVRPRQEQLIRARRLAELGLVDVLTPDRLTAARLSRWLTPGGLRRAGVEPVEPSAVDLDGLARVRRLTQRLLHSAEVSDVAV